MQFSDYVLIGTFIVVVALAGFMYYSRKNYKKVLESQDFIEQNKQRIQIFVIDKKYERPTAQNVPKAIYEKLPKSAKMRKMALVKAKVGPQITTLMCDKAVYEILPIKKNAKVELAGIYIVSVVGVNLADKKKKTWKDKIALKVSGKN